MFFRYIVLLFSGIASNQMVFRGSFSYCKKHFFTAVSAIEHEPRLQQYFFVDLCFDIYVAPFFRSLVIQLYSAVCSHASKPRSCRLNLWFKPPLAVGPFNNEVFWCVSKRRGWRLVRQLWSGNYGLSTMFRKQHMVWRLWCMVRKLSGICFWNYGYLFWRVNWSMWICMYLPDGVAILMP